MFVLLVLLVLLAFFKRCACDCSLSGEGACARRARGHASRGTVLQMRAPCLCEVLVVLTRRSLFGPDGMPCEVLWRPEALDCRLLILQRLGMDLPVTRILDLRAEKPQRVTVPQRGIRKGGSDQTTKIRAAFKPLLGHLNVRFFPDHPFPIPLWGTAREPAAAPRRPQPASQPLRPSARACASAGWRSRTCRWPGSPSAHRVRR